ncbi:polysaccharide deacetylase [Nitrospira sp.]|nr:polysaccharide deacetylase [Nitrospira sp.]
MSDSSPSHCLTFDIEEHFQVSAFASPMRRRHWDQFESRVTENTDKILTMLAARGLRATFFVLGWVAERCPVVVQRIALEGHEVASHGYAHELVTSQLSHEFREDVKKAKGVLEDLCGRQVIGYRAPSFSITKDSLWALPILVEEGYRYDTSVFPVIHDTYGIPGAAPSLHKVSTEKGDLWELPPSTVEFGGVRVPIAGGGYFRFCPYPLFRMLLRKAERAGDPLVTYFHPWELDPEQPRMTGPWLSRVRHYTNLRKTEPRLIQLLSEFSFGAIRDVIKPIRELYQTDATAQAGSGTVASSSMTESRSGAARASSIS